MIEMMEMKKLHSDYQFMDENCDGNRIIWSNDSNDRVNHHNNTGCNYGLMHK